ncbi:MAG: Hsp70 family protein [Actinobacteria bacterium]|nr:MAG: Hsp70 family protein [Actinomycetota bacterium]
MYVLGIDIGTGATRAAVSRLDGTWGEPRPVALGTRSRAVATALRLTGDGQLVEPGDSGPDLVRDFFRRVGDEVPLVLDGQPYLPSALTADLVDLVVGRVEAVEGQPAQAVVVTVPGTWGPHRTRLLHKALRRVGLEQVAVLPAPVAAVEGYPDGDTVAVFSLGATDCECALVGRTGAGGFDLLACAEPTEPVGGADFDDALMEWVQEQVSGPVVCERGSAAREALSTASSTTVRALGPDGPVTLAVSRDQFEELIGPLVDGTVDALLAVLGSGPAPAGVRLVGGATATPLVRRRIEEVVAAAVRVTEHPADSVALGAAAAARRLVDPPDAMAAYRPDVAEAESQLSTVDPGGDLALPPPRPPVVITALEPPRRRGARRL